MASYERTKYEAILDVDYAIELHFRHTQFFKHLSGFFTLLTLLGGSTIAITASKLDPTIPAVIGGIVVVISLLEVTIKPTAQAAQHADTKRRWANLRAESEDMELQEIDKNISRLREIDDHIIRSLEIPAYNANVKRHGRAEFAQKPNILNRIMGALS